MAEARNKATHDGWNGKGTHLDDRVAVERPEVHARLRLRVLHVLLPARHHRPGVLPVALKRLAVGVARARQVVGGGLDVAG